jgi:hypothetical protein
MPIMSSNGRPLPRTEVRIRRPSTLTRRRRRSACPLPAVMKAALSPGPLQELLEVAGRRSARDTREGPVVDRVGDDVG